MRTALLALLLACFVAPYLVTPGDTEKGRASLSPATDRLAIDAEAPSGRLVPVERRSVPPPATYVRIAPIVAAAVTRQGLVSWVDPRFGRYYLALPYPRGTRATICGIGGCITRVSTDYGPSQRIHPDRIADLSAVDFEYVCAVPRRFGLCNATLTILKRGSGPLPRAIPTAPTTNISEGSAE